MIHTFSILFTFLRRDEVRTLRSQIEYLKEETSFGEDENDNDVEGGEGSTFFGLKTQGNKNSLILNQYRNHVEELSAKHLSDLSRLRAQLEDKVRVCVSTCMRACKYEYVLTIDQVTTAAT